MNNDRKDNIIQFPHLKERFIDKGMLSLKSKNYRQALDFFSEAKKLDEDTAEIHLGIALCLMELGQLREAKEVCKKMLNEDLGHYFTVLQIYLTILIQLREYPEVQATIEAVLEENHLPAESAEQFYKLLDFSRKMNSGETHDIIADEEEEDVMPERGFEELQIEEQLSFIQSLKDRNISQHMVLLQHILSDPQAHPLLKSMVLQLLKEHGIEKDVQVFKFGEMVLVKPSQLEDVTDMPFTKKVLNVLEDMLGNENPALYEAVKELWVRHLFVMLPALPNPAEAKVWAAALHAAGYEMHGIHIESDEIQEMYGVPSWNIIQAKKRIFEIEEISYL
ncbi:tetratricopeptide repeat protein [Bacillus lacus]|uniref:Tetratricopeptide repeat protein n=1 Tax=Metabacillus lacus TaxID=1983721 RepID=A0A7X2J302_9BACI|nr:tetratricopeptide repeat protein [Metabacillus lacus]MRX74217.1 tetratricopeptide repeat protein [Metabacillus lacus]